MQIRKWLLASLALLPSVTGMTFDLGVTTGIRQDVTPYIDGAFRQTELRAELRLPVDADYEVEAEARVGLKCRDQEFGFSSYDARLNGLRHIKCSFKWLSDLHLTSGLAFSYQESRFRGDHPLWERLPTHLVHDAVEMEAGSIVWLEKARDGLSRFRYYWVMASTGGAQVADVFSWLQLKMGVRMHIGGLYRYSSFFLGERRNNTFSGSRAYGANGWMEVMVVLFGRTRAALGIDGSSWYAISERVHWGTASLYASLSHSF